MINKTAVEVFIEKLRKEHGESIFRNCSYDDALRDEKYQMHSTYLAGMLEKQDTTIKTTSQYALDYIYKTYGK